LFLKGFLEETSERKFLEHNVDERGTFQAPVRDRERERDPAGEGGSKHL
jgi:hypothetical protein